MAGFITFTAFITSLYFFLVIADHLTENTFGKSNLQKPTIKSGKKLIERKHSKEFIMLWQKGNYYELVVVPILAVTVVILNSSQIIYTIKHQCKRKWQSSRIFILNVAIADLLVPISIVAYKTFANTISQFMLTMSLQASVSFLLGLTMDRLYAVKIPMKYRVIKAKHVFWFCIFLWVICFAVATISSLILVYAKSMFRDLNETFLPSIIYFGIVIIAATYIFILHKLYKNIGKTKNNGKGIRKTCLNEVYKKREKKLAMYSIFVCLSFILSWLPYALAKTFLYHGVLQLNNHVEILKVLFSFLLLNGIIDPLLFKLYIYNNRVNNVNQIKEKTVFKIKEAMNEQVLK